MLAEGVRQRARNGGGYEELAEGSEGPAETEEQRHGDVAVLLRLGLTVQEEWDQQESNRESDIPTPPSPTLRDGPFSHDVQSMGHWGLKPQGS